MKISLWPRKLGYRLADWLETKGFYVGQWHEAWNEGYDEGFEDGTSAASDLDYGGIFDKGYDTGFEIGRIVGNHDKKDDDNGKD